MNAFVNFVRWRIRQYVGLKNLITPKLRPHQNQKKVLCLVCGGLGDRLMALPALRRLRALSKDAKMTVVWMQGDLPPVSAEFNAVYSHGAKKKIRTWFLSRKKWDYVFVTSQGVFSVFTEWCVVATHAPVSIGPVSTDREHKRSIYSRPFVIDSTVHETVLNYRAVGGGVVSAPLKYPIKVDVSKSRRIFNHRRIGIHTGVGAGYEIKRWPFEKVRELIELLCSDTAIEVVLFTNMQDEKDALAAATHLPVRVEAPSDCVMLFNELAQCDCVIANDSGPAHAASALGVPVVVLFGPTNYVRTAPVFNKGEVVRAPCEEGPCFDTKGGCENPVCLTNISADMVYQAVLRVQKSIY